MMFTIHAHTYACTGFHNYAISLELQKSSIVFDILLFEHSARYSSYSFSRNEPRSGSLRPARKTLCCSYTATL